MTDFETLGSPSFATTAEISDFVCDYCGAGTYQVRRRLSRRLSILNSKWRVVSCAACALKALHPKPTDQELSQIYDAYPARGDRVTVEKQRRPIYETKLARLAALTPGKRLLDIGAGLGTFVHTARSQGFVADGLEYLGEHCDLAAQIWNVDLIPGMIETHEFPAGTEFDIIHMHHVLEHFRQPSLALRRSHELLSDGGILLLEVPNQFGELTQELKALFGRYVTLPPDKRLHHMYFFTPRSVRAYLRRFGFEILELNMFRPRRRPLSAVETFAKDGYRQLLNRLSIGGPIIEVFARKIPARKPDESPGRAGSR